MSISYRALISLHRQWGNWTLDSDTLAHVNGHYDIPLARVRADADIDDWVRQVALKRWATVEDLDDLEAALNVLVSAKVAA